ncbi:MULTISPECIES: hypothetical protein [unclassified Streptomyces]|uniref:hypothetical protein n=1 Tax=unclassified Streptomyces TaxID=2593676 RepID=UPI00226DDD5C|nr:MULTISPECIES: hypothetical protein [unclassified Streptomyces]MCY0919598.1 hypothetical protein [Streptomyces sp. H27-G5]MCY0959650.1 hypothetical protein [Streptomyces sp. H27-H5]
MAYTGWLASMRTTAARLNAISGIWTPYTPTWTSSTGAAVSLGNGTLEGEYALSGGICRVRISLVAGSTTTFGGGQFKFALPFAAASLGAAGMSYLGTAVALDPGGAYYPGAARVLSGDAFVMALSPTAATGATPGEWNASRPFTWGNTDNLSISLAYKPV